MGRSLAEQFPVCRATFDEADRTLGQPLSRLCFEGPAEHLQLTEHTQPAILTVSVAACRLVTSRGLTADFLAGHSLGEYAAHVAAGTFSFADALLAVRERGRYMQQAVPEGMGAMAVVLGAELDLVLRACADAANGDVVSPANLNAPGQVVIAGHRDAVRRAGERAKALGAKRIIPLAVSAPFHCALMKPAADRLSPVLHTLATADPRIPVVTNVDAEPVRSASAALDALIRQVAAPVRWEEVVRRLATELVDTYVELGPGTVLTGLVKKIDRQARTAHVEDAESLIEAEAVWQTPS